MFRKKRSLLIILVHLMVSKMQGQSTFPYNGINDERNTTYAFVNARIFIDYQTIIEAGTMVTKNNAIDEVGVNLPIPKGAYVIDLQGKTIYPSFIEICSDYGIPELKTRQNDNRRGPQFLSNTKGAYGWNQAVRPEIHAYMHFAHDHKRAEALRSNGFGTVASFNKDGIVRGTGAAILLSSESENRSLLRNKIAAYYSFNKGSSSQDYRDSRMGAIALLRQTFYDARWYKETNPTEKNISLEEFITNTTLPQIIETSDWQDALRADKVGDEFNFQFIIKGNGDEYSDLQSVKNSGATYIVPVNYPEAYDVSDPWDAINVSLGDLKHWELAPANAAMLEQNEISFCFTADGLKEKKDFLKNIRKAVEYGLSEKAALKALTYQPATLLSIDKMVGALRKGMLANFIITGKNIFDKECIVYENWCNGKRFILKQINLPDVRGNYSLIIDRQQPWQLKLSGDAEAPVTTIVEDTSKIKAGLQFSNDQVVINFDSRRTSAKGNVKLTGSYNSQTKRFNGTGYMPDGSWVSWSASLDSAYIPTVTKDTTTKALPKVGDIWYPNMAYGWKTLPREQKILLKNATVWTNENEGIIQNCDVLIGNGKILGVGKNLVAGDAMVMDATGMHITSGIIDEHSHIAVTGGVNECTQSVTSEVRIGDVINCEDVNIYRQLAGGVTCSHILHGSCNPVGGQTQLIKLRYGMPPEKLKFDGADGFIKFALGENVKQSNWGDFQTSRYPQTRMGVEQTYYNAFTRALTYEQQWKNYSSTSAKGMAPRKDLELDALVEILRDKRFITCHSYVQSEINMLMHVADSFDFTVNTFTHILEGYKVADKMKKHGAGASSFSDWWAYKYEVIEAIPYNGKILHEQGITVAFNSDDAEMARRLNQEAAKAIMYGKVSEEDAWKFVTLNPAKLLHIDNKVGSLKQGKDADVVVWTDNPLSIYAKVVKTFVDGICYFDINDNQVKEKELVTERARLIQKMQEAKNKGVATQSPSFKLDHLYHCNDKEQLPH
ncbi:MAG: amidohydrolase family protein [Bacteroidetes bacterium]|nr:amidohydrolase family protein [Bacteroidota bacterium]